MTSSEQAASAYQQGLTHLQRAEYDAAVASFTESIRLDPTRAPAYAGRALAYRSLEETPRALQDENKVRELGGIEPSHGKLSRSPSQDWPQAVHQRIVLALWLGLLWVVCFLGALVAPPAEWLLLRVLGQKVHHSPDGPSPFVLNCGLASLMVVILLAGGALYVGLRLVEAWLR
jgi:hypothetical protein